MIVLDYIRKIKETGKKEISFIAMLENAKNHQFSNKETILEHFDCINVKEKGSYIHLKYNTKKMFKKPWNDFYMKTRALVVDWVNEKIVLYPFDKFFELDEHKTTKLKEVQKKLKNAQTVEITEKIDGSLIVVRYYKGKVFLVSSGSFEGPHVEIAKEILENDKNLKSFIQNHENYTFMLEMKNATIPQLIKYNENKLTIIGMRNMHDFRLLTRNEIKELAKNTDVSIAPEFNLSVEEMLEIMEDPNTTNNEGYILRIDDFLVKMKTKNFIMANRFAGEPARNFNMVIEAINEKREEAIRPMIKQDYLESYDVFVHTIKKYATDKEQKLQQMYAELDSTGEMSDFVKEAQRKFHHYVKDLIAMRNGRYQSLAKDDIKYLKQYAEYFTCVSHYKYAEMNNLEVEEVLKDLESGKIKYLKKFTDTYNNVDVYIIHKWQWLDTQNI